MLIKPVREVEGPLFRKASDWEQAPATKNAWPLNPAGEGFKDKGCTHITPGAAWGEGVNHIVKFISRPMETFRLIKLVLYLFAIHWQCSF